LADALAAVLDEIEVAQKQVITNEEEEIDEARAVSQLGRGDWRKPRSWERGLMGEELGREREGEMYG
jgi:hypothetical protein